MVIRPRAHKVAAPTGDDRKLCCFRAAIDRVSIVITARALLLKHSLFESARANPKSDCDGSRDVSVSRKQ